MARHREPRDNGRLEPEYVGGEGGDSRIRRMAGSAAVDMMLSTRIDCRTVRMRGERSWPSADPIEPEIAMAIVAVVRLLRSNHLSENMGPSIWDTGFEIAPKN